MPGEFVGLLVVATRSILLLRRALAAASPAKCALSAAVKVTGSVKRWRDGNVRLRWGTAGLLRAEERFRRIKGHK